MVLLSKFRYQVFGATEGPPGFMVWREVGQWVDPGLLQGENQGVSAGGVEDSKGGNPAVVAVKVVDLDWRGRVS